MTDLDSIVERILKEKPELTREHIHRLIQRKIQEMEGLLTEEGAAYVVASELGVKVGPTVVKQEVALSDLVPGLRDVTVAGRVIFLYPATVFYKADGSKGKVARGVLADRARAIELVFWGDKAELVESGRLKQGDVLRIMHGYTRVGAGDSVELHAGNRASIEINPPALDATLFPQVEEFVRKIGELREGDRNVHVIAVVKQAYPLKRFKGSAVRRIRIADGSGAITAVFWGELAELIQDVRKGQYLRIFGARVKGGKGRGLELHVEEGSQVQVSCQRPDEIAPLSTLPIASLRGGMTGFNLLAQVVAVDGPRRYKADGREGDVATLLIKDDSGVTELTLWNDSALIARVIKPGDVVLAEDCSARVRPRGVMVVALNRSGFLTINPPSAKLLHVGTYKAKISELREGIVELIEGAIATRPRVRTITLKSGRQARAVSFDLNDGSGRAFVSLWGEAAERVEELSEGSVVRIQNVVARRANGGFELRSSRFTKLTVLKVQRIVQKIAELRDGDLVSLKAEVVDLPEKAYVYKACPICLRKVSEVEGRCICSKCGEVEPITQLVVDVILRDETGEILATCYGDVAESVLGIQTTEVVGGPDPMQLFRERKKLIIGRKASVHGKVVYDEFLSELKVLARGFKFLNL